MDEYTVTYLEHSVFHAAIKKTAILTKPQFISLLQMGLVTVLEANIK